MDSVWAAKRRGDASSDRWYAVKTFLPECSANAQFRAAFLEEARIASLITHPNVAQVVEAGEHAGVLFLVTEWVDGCSAHDLKRAIDLEGHRMPIATALRIVSDACAGLHAAHELRGENDEALDVMHCRLTPRKIMVGTDGTARIIDFGVGRSSLRFAQDTGVPARKGTLAYMAPELATDKPFDRRADIRSLGAILYELLSSRPPYLGETDRQTLALLTSGRPPPRLGAPVPKSVEAIVRRALALDAVSRYQTAADFRTALSGAMLAADLHLSPKDLVVCLRTYVPQSFASDAPLSSKSIEEVADATGSMEGSTDFAQAFARGVPIDVGDDKPTAAMFVGDIDSGPVTAPTPKPPIEPPPPEAEEPIVAPAAQAERAPEAQPVQAEAPAPIIGLEQAEPSPAPDKRRNKIRMVGLVALVVVLGGTGALAARVVFDGPPTFQPTPAASSRAAASSAPVAATVSAPAVASAQPSASASVAPTPSQEPPRPAPKGRTRRRGDRVTPATTASGTEEATPPASATAPPASAKPAPTVPPEDESGL